MQKLYNLLQNYTLQDALKLEREDPQYKSLEKLYQSLQDKNLFLWLIIANSIVCYQLSSTWEKYWEEFSKSTSDYFSEQIQGRFPSSREWQSIQIITFLKQFLPNSKWNKRLLEIKIKRLEKLEWFIDIFLNNTDYYSWNLIILRNELTNTMNQKKDAKTIVFAIKMVMYGIDIDKRWKKNEKSNKEQSLDDISIPIDSRLINIFGVYKEDYTDIKKFYRDLSIKLDIPEIHLDAILWINYEKLIQK